MNIFERSIRVAEAKIQGMRKKPIRNFFEIRKIKRHIKALQEGQRDILNPNITNSQTTASVVDKNNYRIYSGQVCTSYDMYNSRTEYGGEYHRGIVDTRVAFLGGAGLSVVAETQETQDYIDKFLELNKLHGSKLMQMITTGELEGKDLILLKPRVTNKEDKSGYIVASSFSWWVNKYSIFGTLDNIKDIKYTPKDDERQIEESISTKQAVYVKLGGSEDRLNEATNRIHCVLTQIENASRAYYDLRKNSHIFGKIMPYWETPNQASSKAINNDVNSGDWQVGQGYAGEAKFSFVEPSGGAWSQIREDILMSLKAISTSTGIPIHWMAWPELMSNRATAENLLEVVSAATRKERLIWEEAFKEIIVKSMNMAIDAGFENNSIKGPFAVKLPLMSLADLKLLAEVWLPLQQTDVISMATLRNKVPDINPSEEQRVIESERDRAIQEIGTTTQARLESICKDEEDK